MAVFAIEYGNLPPEEEKKSWVNVSLATIDTKSPPLTPNVRPTTFQGSQSLNANKSETTNKPASLCVVKR